MAKNINSIEELLNLLKNELGDRVGEPELFDSFHSRMLAKIDGQTVVVMFTPHNNCVLVSGPEKGKMAIEAIKSVINEALDDNEPLCSYSLVKTGEPSSKFSMEWNIKDPEGRLKQIQSGTGFTAGLHAENLVVLNGLDPSLCVETEEEKEERISKLKIHGIYPGELDPEKVALLPEDEVFLMIHSYKQKIEFLLPLFKIGLPGVDISEDEYSLEYLIYQTRRFGVDIPEPQVNEHVVLTPEYEAWYKFWNNHFFNVLSNRKRNKYGALKLKGKDVSRLLPKGDWRELIEKPAEMQLRPRNEE